MDPLYSQYPGEASHNMSNSLILELQQLVPTGNDATQESSPKPTSFFQFKMR